MVSRGSSVARQMVDACAQPGAGTPAVGLGHGLVECVGDRTAGVNLLVVPVHFLVFVVDPFLILVVLAPGDVNLKLRAWVHHALP